MSEKQLILTVDTNHHNLKLLNKFLEKEGYQTISANSLEELDQILNQSLKIQLVLLDLTGFKSSIWERCEQIKNRQIPFLVISPRQNTVIQQASLAHGARSMLIKPLAIKQFLGLIKSFLKD
ncbi:response regulator receiver protein [Stanieria cyanosphaera PCC 7437]|uniref:Response regulator receiver protein n=1 Tax=Stanieria cyanosphaera (strain ATCC 29371 / PCC 7437) TaxID=111780 RepID=K9XSY0_STAC7|nr:response regulator [Stanieria cyanosphaera]AFZ35638.1 response regulator receiver protein [Stanieria cyanosphaera PCC 7437]